MKNNLHICLQISYIFKEMNRENSKKSDSNAEYKNAASSLVLLAKANPGKHLQLITNQFMGLITSLSNENLTESNIDDFDVIKDCIETLLKVDDKSEESMNKDSNKTKGKQNLDVNSLANGNHKQTGSSYHSGFVKEKVHEAQKLSDKISSKKDRKSEVGDEEASKLIAQHSQSSDRDNQYLASKNSWLDTNRRKYYSDIDEMFSNNMEQVIITVELGDFRNLDFGDYHGSVKTTKNNFTAYRFDKDPYQSIIYFFNMITKGSKKKEKVIPKLYFDVQRIKDPKALVHDVFVSVSPLERNKDRQETDSPITRVVGGIQDGDSDEESVEESVSTSKSKEGGGGAILGVLEAALLNNPSS